MTAEDEPAEQVKARLAGAKYVAFVTLEPIGSDKDAYSLLERTVRDLANGCSGVWVDPNGDVYGSEEGSFG
jgi:hypothetical protein